ncbi:MAG TPA: AAA family ATPase [Solirubrobacterales bacterium]|nr:AAA family ATPase [Solirubrobacterales bacterium]
MASSTTLIGREAEGAQIERLLDGVRNGESGALLVRGEAGVGKTALLDAAVESAADLRVLRTLGVESEMELPFAGLHQLCRPLLGSLDLLPAPQLEALQVAFGLKEGATPDRFLVALAVLTLLSDVAEEQPLLCVVDDAQWLDEASTLALAFVARRLLAESIAIVFVSREAGGALASLPELTIEGISDEHARTLLASRLQGRLDDRVRERIIAETRGNPLALLELPASLTAAELAGGFDLPDARSRMSRTEQNFLRRFESLPPSSQLLLLTAAAEPVGDVALLWRAAEELGVGSDAAVPGEAEGLIELGARVRFRHPLVRSAIYHSASPQERERVHGALAKATDPDADPDRRAWHRAHAATGLDEDVATDLERSAERAQRRGGIGAAAAFLKHAAELTPDPVRRGERAMAAAQAKVEAGAPDAALELAEMAEMAPLGELNRARLQRLRAQIGFATLRGGGAAPALLEAARRLVPLDPEMARETGLEALAAGLYSGSMGDSPEVLDEVRAAPSASPPRPTDLLFDGLATRVTEGYTAGAGPLREALEAFRREQGPSPASDRWLWLACRVTSDSWDEETWEELANRGTSRARAAGALDVLPIVAIQQSGTCIHSGRFSEALALGEEAAGILEAVGSATLMFPIPMLSAYQGKEDETLAMIEAVRDDVQSGGRGTALCMLETAGAILCNGLGRYEDALAFAERAFAVGPLARYAMAPVELVEAAARCGRDELATTALEALVERTQASGTDWALGLELRSRALLSDGSEADRLYAEAVERHLRTRLAPHRARTQLLYGEWLRREKRRVDAREQLRAAHETFTQIGAAAFAERAGRELQATGETVRKRSEETADVLTPQEAQIARMARDGLSNTEIGAQLFISPRTVQYHLHKVFPKLGITSRRQLGRVPPGLLNPS